MIRVAFTLIGGKDWTGGYNYLLNLLQALATYQHEAITPILFIPAEGVTDVDAFSTLPGLQVVSTELLNIRHRKSQLLQALIWGRAPAQARLFAEHRIDLVFEAAQFFGWRLGVPALAWIPDFQHKALPHLFSKGAWWKREIGLRAQILGGRVIMLSSDDARHACERHFSRSRGRTRTVRFAVPAGTAPEFSVARAIADRYGLPTNFIFMPNQFWRHKNHMLVLEALSILRERGVDIVVAASGKQHDPRAPEYFPTFQKILGERGLEASFRLLGLIPYDHINALMVCCQAMLNPSLFEGWSTTVEEARALGTPMLLSNLDVHREQMGSKAQYFHRDSAEALADLILRVPPFQDLARRHALQSAHGGACARVRRFAEDFAGLAKDTAKASSV